VAQAVFERKSRNTTRNTPSVAKIAPAAAIAAVVTYQTLLIALIFLRPDLDPSWHTISEWAIGPFGWLMALAFFFSGLSYAALYISIRPQVRDRLGRVGMLFLLWCAIGTAAISICTTDPLDAKELSLRGTLHIIFGTSALMLLPLGALLLNLSLARRWSSSRRALLWSAGLPLFGLVAFVGYTLVFVVPLGDAYGPGVNIGWPPRFALFT
jgi:hypothetical protein